MNRRTLLRRTGAVGAVALAGCLGRDDPASGDTTTDDGTTMPTDSPEPVSVVDSSIVTTATSCRSSDADETATVAIDGSAGRVTVTGVLHASNPCHRAWLQGVSYPPESGTLALDVATESTEQVCVECVGTVEYRAEVTLSGGVPDRVAVTHQGEPVETDSDSGGGSGGEGEENPVLTASAIAVLESNPTGSDTDPGDIEFRSETNEVVVSGTVRARNGCETAMVEDLAYAAETDTLSVRVIAEVPPEKEDQMCTQALADLTYRLTVAFQGGLPETAEVSQEGHGGISASHASNTASAASERS